MKRIALAGLVVAEEAGTTAGTGSSVVTPLQLDGLAFSLASDHSLLEVAGALNTHPGCMTSPPSLATVSGLPTVAFGEACAILAQTWMNSFVVVRQLR